MKTKAVAKQSVDFISNNKKYILYAAGIGLAIYLGYKVLKDINKTFTIDDEVKNIGSEIDQKNATITEADARNYAQQLLDAMNQNNCWVCYGTDEEAIFNVFKKLQTKDDFLLVFKAFGKKDYNGYNSPPKGLLKYIDVYSPRNLVYWLKSELSERDGEVYSVVKKMVESAGFSF